MPAPVRARNFIWSTVDQKALDATPGELVAAGKHLAEEHQDSRVGSRIALMKQLMALARQAKVGNQKLMLRVEYRRRGNLSLQIHGAGDFSMGLGAWVALVADRCCQRRALNGQLADHRVEMAAMKQTVSCETILRLPRRAQLAESRPTIAISRDSAVVIAPNSVLLATEQLTGTLRDTP